MGDSEQTKLIDLKGLQVFKDNYDNEVTKKMVTVSTDTSYEELEV